METFINLLIKTENRTTPLQIKTREVFPPFVREKNGNDRPMQAYRVPWPSKETPKVKHPNAIFLITA
jgi:hypothetical protein